MLISLSKINYRPGSFIKMTTSFPIKKKKSKIILYPFQFFKNYHINSNQFLNKPDNAPLKKLEKSMPGLNGTSSPASITFSNKLVHKSDFPLKTPVPASKFTAKTFTRASALWNRYPGRRATFQTGRNVVENWGKPPPLPPSSFILSRVGAWSISFRLLLHPASACINEYPDLSRSVNPCKNRGKNLV